MRSRTLGSVIEQVSDVGELNASLININLHLNWHNQQLLKCLSTEACELVGNMVLHTPTNAACTLLTARPSQHSSTALTCCNTHTHADGQHHDLLLLVHGVVQVGG